MTLDEFEKLLDVYDHTAVMRSLKLRREARQRVLDAYAEILKEDEELNAAIFPTMYKMQELQAQLSETRAEADALRQALTVCLEAIDAAHADPEAGLPSKAWHWWSAARAALSAPPAEEPSR